MNILALDDEKMALAILEDAIKQVLPDENVYAFRLADEALDKAKEIQFDIAFLDIRMKKYTGLEVAMMLKKINPKINIIFATGFSEYQGDAFSMHASGYLTKPITPEAVKNEVDNLRFPVSIENKPSDKVVAKTFGNFDIFAKGEMVHFKRALSKEVLAYLVNKKGAYVTRQELSVILFEDDYYSRKTQDYLSKIYKSLVESLEEAGIADILVKQHNSYSVDVEKISCDAWDYLEGKPEALNAFKGEYMAQYLWNEEEIYRFYKDYK